MTDVPRSHEVRIPEAVLDQLDEARAFIEAQGAPLAAERFARRLEAAILSLAQFPHRGRASARGVRSLLAVPPYIIQYRIRSEIVEVISVRHGARR